MEKEHIMVKVVVYEKKDGYNSKTIEGIQTEKLFNRNSGFR